MIYPNPHHQVLQKTQLAYYRSTSSIPSDYLGSTPTSEQIRDNPFNPPTKHHDYHIGQHTHSHKVNQIYIKIGTVFLIPNFNTQKGISKKLQPLRKGPYQITAKPTDVTYKITDSDQNEIVQHRNNQLPYYPKAYALRELTQLYSFTGLKVIQNHPHTENEINEQNDIHLEKQNKKPTTTQNNTKKLDQKIPQKERENRKMIEKIIPQEQVEKSEHRESSRLRNQPRKNYKTFIPQSKILKKIEFQKQL